jgi:hypothetical protein
MVKRMMDYLKKDKRAERVYLDLSEIIKHDNGSTTRKWKAAAKHDAKPALQEFYPWLSLSLQDYYQAYLDSEESVLLLLGDAGLGKSTFLRSFLHYADRKTILVVDEKAVLDPVSVLDYDFDIAIYEDVDRFLGKRTDGNSVMAALLNAADGIVKENKQRKIIFSTNLSSLNKVDEALVRVGRCFDILEFRHLTREEAEAANAAVGLDGLVQDKDSYTLAEATAKYGHARQAIGRFNKPQPLRSVGFGT